MICKVHFSYNMASVKMTLPQLGMFLNLLRKYPPKLGKHRWSMISRDIKSTFSSSSINVGPPIVISGQSNFTFDFINCNIDEPMIEHAASLISDDIVKIVGPPPGRLSFDVPGPIPLRSPPMVLNHFFKVSDTLIFFISLTMVCLLYI